MHSDGVDAFLEVAGFVDDQHGTGVAEVIGDIASQVVADLVGVLDCFAQQVLYPVGLSPACSDTTDHDQLVVAPVFRRPAGDITTSGWRTRNADGASRFAMPLHKYRYAVVGT